MYHQQPNFMMSLLSIMDIFLFILQSKPKSKYRISNSMMKKRRKNYIFEIRSKLKNGRNVFLVNFEKKRSALFLP